MSPAAGGGRTGHGENALYRKGPPKWCDLCRPDDGESASAHKGPHTRFVGEMLLSRNAICWTVALTLESGSAYEPHPVLWLGMRVGAPVPVHLSWQHASTLAGMLLEARRRYA